MLLMGSHVAAIAQFSAQGEITFERKTNLKQQYMTDEDNDRIKSMIDKVAPFTISEFTLAFHTDKSLYSFQKEVEVQGMNFS